MEELICGNCGKKSKTVREIIDPYAKELYDEENLVNLCPECEHESIMDI